MAAGLGALAAPAVAATPDFTVNSVWDWPDATAGDGKCESTEPHAAGKPATCTLRAALQESNQSGGGGTIFLPAKTILMGFKADATGKPVQQDFTLLAPFLIPFPVNADVTIKQVAGVADGAAIVDGGFWWSVFHIGAMDSNKVVIATANVTISGITITHGGEKQASSQGAGGGALVHEGSTLSLNRVKISGNQTTGPGGGLANYGTTTLLDSTVENNCGLSGAGGGVFQGSGAGIYNVGEIVIKNSTITGNYTERGAGLNNAGGKASIYNSTISNNVARTNGAGIRNEANGRLAISRTTITENWAQTRICRPDATNTCTVAATVQSGKECPALSGNALGFGLAFGDIHESGETVKGGENGGGISNINGSQIVMGWTILSGNHLGRSINGATHQEDVHSGTADCFSPDTSTAPGPGLIIDYHNNLIGIWNTNCRMREERCKPTEPCFDANKPPFFDVFIGMADPKSEFAWGTPVHQQAPFPAGLGNLQNDGGPTFTHPLLEGSADIDGISMNDPDGTDFDPMPDFGVARDFFACFPSTVDGFKDQRGLPRPRMGISGRDPVCDIGASELQAPKTLRVLACSGTNVVGADQPLALASCDGGNGVPDLLWDQASIGKRELEPKNGAKLKLLTGVNFNSLTLTDLKAVSFGTTPIIGNDDSTNQIKPGTIIAARNAAGHFTKLLVSKSGADLVLSEAVTYQRPVKISGLTVADSANRADWSVRSDLKVGDTAYGDRTFKITALPQELLGASWVRPANDSKMFSSTPVVTFTIDRDAFVYLAIDSRLGIRGWMDATWSAAAGSITDSESPVRDFQLFRKFFAAGEVVSLGGNSGPTMSNQYLVIVP